MRRTTISLDEGVYWRVRRLAERKGKSMARMIEELIRASLDPEPQAPVLPLHRDNGPRPGVQIADRSHLYDLMEGRLGGGRPEERGQACSPSTPTS